jgi:hypothetical protein
MLDRWKFSFVGNDMGQKWWGRVWLMLAALVMMFAGEAGIAHANDDAAPKNASKAAASRKSAQAKADAPLTGEAAIRAKCKADADSAVATGAVIGAIAGGIIGAVIVGTMASNDAAKQETACVRAKGNPAGTQKELARAKAEASPSAEPKRASVSGGGARGSVSASGSTCACPQMTTCTGSWATLTCTQLKNRCRTANSPMTYTVNACDRLKELVGAF